MSVTVYIAALWFLSGCEDGGGVTNNDINPIGVWSGTKEDSDSKNVVISYSLGNDSYEMTRSVGGTIDYSEKGTWILNSSDVFTFTPDESKVLNTNSGELEVNTAEVEYTAVYFEGSFTYYYWDINSEFMIIDIEKK